MNTNKWIIILLITLIINSSIIALFSYDDIKASKIKSEFQTCLLLKTQQECWNGLEVEPPLLFSKEISGQGSFESYLLNLADAPSSQDGYHIFYIISATPHGISVELTDYSVPVKDKPSLLCSFENGQPRMQTEDLNQFCLQNSPFHGIEYIPYP